MKRFLLPLLTAAALLLPAPASAQLACYFEASHEPLGGGRAFGCTVTSRRNANGHRVVDVRWSDGQRSSYVFWTDGTVDIISHGRTHHGIWRSQNGVTVIVTPSGAITGLPF